MKHQGLRLFFCCLVAHSSIASAADQTYNFELPSKIKITIVEAPYAERPASACPGAGAAQRADSYRPKTYVKSTRAFFQGQTIRFDVTCMTDAWNGRPLRHEGVVRYFGGWCKLYDKKPYCGFRGIFADGCESFAAEWYANGNVAKRTVLSGSSDIIDLFMKNIDPPEYE